jgi:signal transduction histidine kinase
MSHPPNADHSHRMARLIRHEVGDLLQSVYSTVAVLMERLPPESTLERRLTADLKNRAELCKNELDAIVDLSSPGEVNYDRVDLAAIFAGAVGQARRRHPGLTLAAQAAPAVSVIADGRALAAAAFLLLTSACQAARNLVRVSFSQAERHVDCLVERDGYPVPPEQLAWLRSPFTTTQGAAFGLGLALTRRAVGGGEVEASNGPDGVTVRVRFPVCMEP